MARRNAKRDTIKVPVTDQYGSHVRLDTYSLEGPLSKAVEALQALAVTHEGRAIELEWEQERFDDSYAFHLYERRPETDEEMTKRLGDHAAHAARVREQELETLRRLQAKYPDAVTGTDK